MLINYRGSYLEHIVHNGRPSAIHWNRIESSRVESNGSCLGREAEQWRRPRNDDGAKSRAPCSGGQREGENLPGQVGFNLFVAARAGAYGQLVDGKRLKAERLICSLLLLLLTGGRRITKARLQRAYLGRRMLLFALNCLACVCGSIQYSSGGGESRRLVSCSNICCHSAGPRMRMAAAARKEFTWKSEGNAPFPIPIFPSLFFLSVGQPQKWEWPLRSGSNICILGCSN